MYLQQIPSRQKTQWRLTQQSVEQLPLHQAIRDNNASKFFSLIDSGVNIHARDLFNSTPLHLATFYHRLDMVTHLIEKGAQVDATAYGGVTPLYIAVDNHDAPLIQILLDAGANPNQAEELLSPYLKAFEHLHEKTIALSTQEVDPSTLTIELVQALDILKLFNQNGWQTIQMVDGIPESIPLSLAIIGLSEQCTHPKIRQYLLNYGQELLQESILGHFFLLVKDIFHAFPTGELYEVLFEENLLLLTSEGHLRIFTTPKIENLLAHYLEDLNKKSPDSPQIPVFEKIHQLFSKSARWSFAPVEDSTVTDILQHYEHNQNVLLAAGWEGHAIDVYLDQEESLLMVANSGQRFTNLPPGALFYEIGAPHHIDDALIASFLEADSRIFNEYTMHYLLKLNLRYILENDPQSFGNCAWKSHQSAIEGLIFLELIKEGIPPDDALVLTDSHFEQWEQFYKTSLINELVQLDGPLYFPFDGLIDLLTQHTNIEDPNVMERGHMLLDLLCSTVYLEEFQDYIQNTSTYWKGLDPLLESYGIDVILKRLPNTEAIEPVAVGDISPFALESHEMFEPEVLTQTPNLEALEPSSCPNPALLINEVILTADEALWAMEDTPIEKETHTSLSIYAPQALIIPEILPCET